MKSDRTDDEIKEHKQIMYGLMYKGLINDDQSGYVKMTESGTQKVHQITEPLTLEEIALILIAFCESEKIPYHFINGVVRPVEV